MYGALTAGVSLLHAARTSHHDDMATQELARPASGREFLDALAIRKRIETCLHYLATMGYIDTTAMPFDPKVWPTETEHDGMETVIGDDRLHTTIKDRYASIEEAWHNANSKIMRNWASSPVDPHRSTTHTVHLSTLHVDVRHISGASSGVYRVSYDHT